MPTDRNQLNTFALHILLERTQSNTVLSKNQRLAQMRVKLVTVAGTLDGNWIAKTTSKAYKSAANIPATSGPIQHPEWLTHVRQTLVNETWKKLLEALSEQQKDGSFRHSGYSDTQSTLWTVSPGVISLDYEVPPSKPDRIVATQDIVFTFYHRTIPEGAFEEDRKKETVKVRIHIDLDIGDSKHADAKSEGSAIPESAMSQSKAASTRAGSGATAVSTHGTFDEVSGDPKGII